MATITRENVAPLTDKITVALAKEDYYPQFEKSLKAYAKKANMQGFRPGQVPQGLVKKMYGQSIFTEEVLKMVEKEVNNYLTEQNPEIFAQPLPSDENDARNLDMNNPKDLSFSFEIGLKPEVNVPDLGQATVTRHKVTVTDEMINQEIEYYQERAGQQSDVEAVEKDENLVTLQFTEVVAEGTENAAPVNKEVNIYVKDFSEGTRPQLIGLKKGDTLTVTLNEAFSQETLNWLLRNLGTEDTSKQFTLTINAVKFTEKHPLNEELFKQVFPNQEITDEAAFRAEIKKAVENYWTSQDRGQVDDQIYHFLLDHTTIDLPEGFLKKWIRQGGEQPKTEEEAEQSWPSFRNSLKWTLISDTLIKQHGVQVQPEDIRNHAAAQVMGYMGGQADPSQMPWLEGYLDKMVKDKKFVEQAYNEIATGKLFDILGSQVQSKEEWMSRDEFIKQQEHHREHHHH